MRAWFAVLLCSMGLLGGSANAEAAGRIYLVRGLANVFSTGLDSLNDKLVSRGFASTVHNHLEYSTLAEEAAKLEKAGKGPIIIIGHSLGADNAMLMASEMNQSRARVALLVLFGPDYSMPMPANVARVINYYGGDAIATRGPRFSGTLENISFDKMADVNHFNVEKIERFHSTVIARIQSILARKPKPTEASAQSNSQSSAQK